MSSVLRHRTPLVRESDIERLTHRLTPQQKIIVLTQVATQLCDIVDGLCRDAELRDRIDRAMQETLIELDLTSGVPGRNGMDR